MKYIRQFGLILLFSLAGDLCHRLLPFPVPASIYGMVLLLLSLLCRLVRVENVKETGNFLVSLLPLLFVVPTVGLMTCWDLIRADVLEIAVVIVITTILTFGVSGTLTRIFRKGGDDNG